MKIALCLSGQPRGLVKAYEYVQRNVLCCNDVDVFCHVWNEEEKVKSLYKPKKILAESQNKIKLNKEYKTRDNINHPAINTFCFFYSLYMANSLREEYEKENNIKYDIVIRSRYDFAIARCLNFSEYDTDKIWTPLIKIPMPSTFVCTDQFAFSSSQNMSDYSKVYEKIEYYYDSGILINGEDLLAAHIKKINLINKISYVDMWDPFYGGKYNYGPHSLVRDDMEQWVK